MAPNFVSTPTVPSSISTIEERHHHSADRRKARIATKIASPPSAPWSVAARKIPLSRAHAPNQMSEVQRMPRLSLGMTTGTTEPESPPRR
ncbi:hypothetical protein B277_13819 [Janibacter hoylei PVAS-1]|uniref:Uncharacterized protein n=1 Tax=Janibacter hoylei PVAS-1 TaxID=1210046 RepID=K1DZR3_9MICO|nr:hypothetical protein B277_13819 [Janibacter hoylei PVAS-1]